MLCFYRVHIRGEFKHITFFLFHSIGENINILPPQRTVEIRYGCDVDKIMSRVERDGLWKFYDIDPTTPCSLCSIRPIYNCYYSMHSPYDKSFFTANFHNVENCCSKCHKNGMIDPEDYSFHQWECVKRTHDLQDHVETGNVFPI